MLEICYDGNNITEPQISNEMIGLDEITFCVTKQFYNYKMFLIIKQGTQLETLELKQVNSTKRLYYNYQVEYYPVKLKNGKCEIQILGVNLDNDKTFVTDKVEIKIVNESYNFKVAIYMMEKFNKISSNTYEKMLTIYDKFVELSGMNIDVLDEIEKQKGGHTK